MTVKCPVCSVAFLSFEELAHHLGSTHPETAHAALEERTVASLTEFLQFKQSFEMGTQAFYSLRKNSGKVMLTGW
jgi:hypothetical protein